MNARKRDTGKTLDTSMLPRTILDTEADLYAEALAQAVTRSASVIGGLVLTTQAPERP